MKTFKPFDRAHFLDNYWQKRPYVIRQFIPNFSDPLDEHELAGLATEADIDSRIVSYCDNKWHVEQGPFDDFSSACIGDWTLLVQGVDRYVDELSVLTNYVNFIPNWRFDDVMVSYSEPHAGVGPHIDEYDVFIVQGRGKRRWKIGSPCSHDVILPHPLLKQIDGFTPDIDVVLESGDAIYIPPKHPHNGIALEPCMNYSLGFRAPTNVDILSGVLDEIDPLSIQTRYGDATLGQHRDVSTPASVVTHSELESLKHVMTQLIHNENVVPALLNFLSRQHLELNGITPPLTQTELSTLLGEGYTLDKLPAVRPIHLESKLLGNTFIFFIDGKSYSINCDTDHDQSIVIRFLNTSTYCHHHNSSKSNTENSVQRYFSNQASWIELLCQLVNDGCWELGEPQ